MMLTKHELLLIPDVRSAMHALDVWAHNVTHYSDIAEMIGVARTSELIANGHDYRTSTPSKETVRRAFDLIAAKWRFHRLQTMAMECYADSVQRYREMSKAMGFREDTAETFLSSYFPRRGFQEREVYEAAPRSLRRARTISN